MVDEKIKTIINAKPEDFNHQPLIKALLLDRQGNWQGAHEIAQDQKNLSGDLIHAYLHRKEGDIGNADYWYSRAKAKRPSCSLEEEWLIILKKIAIN